MIKICYVVSTLVKTGVTNILMEILKNLDREKFEVVVVTLSKADLNSYENEIKQMGIKIINLNLNTIIKTFLGKDKLQKIIEKEKIKVVHSHGIRPDYLNSRLVNVLKISTIHNYPLEDYIMCYGKILGLIMAKCNIYFFKKIDYSIACSKSICDKFYKNLNLKFYCIQNGIDERKYTPVSFEEKQLLRKKYGFLKNEYLIIVSGKLIERKNVELILKCIKNNFIKENIKLLIAGNGKLLEKYKIDYENEKIIFLGEVNKIDEYLKLSDCYISASKSEGLPNSVMEAMSVNLTCFLSNIDSHLELELNSDYYFSNEEELCEKIKNYIFNSSKSKINNRFIIEKNLTSLIMTKKYENYYRKRNIL